MPDLLKPGQIEALRPETVRGVTLYAQATDTLIETALAAYAPATAGEQPKLWRDVADKLHYEVGYEQLHRREAEAEVAKLREALEAANYYIDRLKTNLSGRPVRDMEEAEVAYKGLSR